ncbi:MAG TPA: hypothetical protein VLJ79_17360 [Candidatus Binatia bacterium]|nr:hypothetical protein [Candidatus Binatia bacterium]
MSGRLLLTLLLPSSVQSSRKTIGRETMALVVVFSPELYIVAVFGSRFPMRLAVSVCLAVALLFTGTPYSAWSDNTPKIVACAGDANPLAFGETGENYIDERIFISFPLAFETGLSNYFPVGAIVIRRSAKEKQLTKEDRKIYKLTAAFLI